MTSEGVVDASIFNRTYLDEPDRGEAVDFFDFERRFGLQLIAPTIFVYEVLAVAAPSPYAAEKAYELILGFKRSGFRIVDVNEAVIHKAIEISNSGNLKSGYPTFYDSSYHALALVRGGIFLTSDQRHAIKTSGFGGVVLLKDWRMHFNVSLPS